MARVKVHMLCGLPLADCLCESDDEPRSSQPEPDDGSDQDDAAA
jgi:hypothetical protein